MFAQLNIKNLRRLTLAQLYLYILYLNNFFFKKKNKSYDKKMRSKGLGGALDKVVVNKRGDACFDWVPEYPEPRCNQQQQSTPGGQRQASPWKLIEE